MRKPESKFWEKLRKANPKKFMKRIENTASTGMPDVYFCVHPLGSGMMELKISTGKRKLIIEYGTHQRGWARKHVAAGGNQFLVALHNDEALWWFGEKSIDPENHEPDHIGLKWPESISPQRPSW